MRGISDHGRWCWHCAVRSKDNTLVEGFLEFLVGKFYDPLLYETRKLVYRTLSRHKTLGSRFQDTGSMFDQFKKKVQSDDNRVDTYG